MSKMPPHNPGDQDELDRLGEDVEEVVLERRIERRLQEFESSDRPWTRRILGSLIILASGYAGWKMIGARTEEAKVELARIKTQIPPPTAAQTGLEAKNSSTVVSADVASGGAQVDVTAANIIAECTKGADAFRLLNLDANAIAQGTLTLEQAFSEVLKEDRGRVKRTTSLENIRIRTRDGRELRLHITPRDQKGRLFAQLFQVAKDGLPEEIDFPESLADLKTKPVSSELRERFLQLADPPGVPIETERHEAWSFADKSGVQLIAANGFIFDMQVFTEGRFLACARANGKSVCKCVEKH